MEVDEEILQTVLYNPLKLCELCINACVDYPQEALLFSRDTECLMDLEELDEVQSTEHYNTVYELRTPICLPANMWGNLFQRLVMIHSQQYIQAFSDTTKCRLTQINLSISHTKEELQDHEHVSKLFNHALQEVILQGYRMEPSTLHALGNCKDSLQILDLSSVSGLKNFFTLKELKSLVKLNLQHTDIGFSKDHFSFIGSLPRLSWLDLSNTSVDNTSLEELGRLEGTLKWLSLYQCVHITSEFDLRRMLEKLKNLVHLDVSKDPLEQGAENTYPVVTSSLMETFAKMPNLMSLDISGSTGLKLDDLDHFTNYNKQLTFFGLCNVESLSHNSQIFSKKITGEANEEQILTSLEVYLDRVKYVAIALRKLFSLASHHDCQQIERCLRLIVKAMRKFKQNSSIHIAATASLYHLSREDDPSKGDVELRRDIILAILESMENLKGVLQLQKNSCLTLCNFKIPMEVEFQYSRVAKLLLTALKNHADDYLRRIAIMLFNAIVCQNQNNQKKEMGLHGAIQTVMQVIREKVASAQADQLMETCWSALWNITDETPENCRDFLGYGGMDLFMECLNLFPTSLEVHRNMMGLMGNIAEVKELRPRLMRDEYIQLFVSLLRSEPETLEVSYHSAGLLSHMLSDGPSVWKIRTSRDECMQRIIDCIDSWDVNAIRNIHYRSFKPIIFLLSCFDAPAAQHWAAWALANLTKVYPHRYCKLIEKEGGLDALQVILEDRYVFIRTKELSVMVVDSCRQELCFR